ncbi:MAG: hypothetical protein LBJ95_05265 [Oscillospiraceae bacterium]|nr:hypothetical protein [Oscillospiraceae bacterium]
MLKIQTEEQLLSKTNLNNSELAELSLNELEQVTGHGGGHTICDGVRAPYQRPGVTYAHCQICGATVIEVPGYPTLCARCIEEKNRRQSITDAARLAANVGATFKNAAKYGPFGVVIGVAKTVFDAGTITVH